ncbi:MAG TPA: glycerol-3-phosphate acyltransferase [Candidatus Mediterraneibacter norfolkensis]|nr:glycerol-3-phosphate acyltransferase [Candidatus Mediterraneibacter norfolkensis]
MQQYYFFILLGYLSGSILFARLIPKYLYRIDICEVSDDGNPGTFNAFRHAGVRAGILILCLELAKGFFPVHFALRILNPGNRLFAFVLAAPVIGHAFPFPHPREGGKSIAVSFGCLLGLYPHLQPVLTLVVFYLLFSLVVIIEPHMARSIATYACLAAAAFHSFQPRPVVFGTLLLSAVVIIRHVTKAEKTEREPVSIRLPRRSR